MIAARHCCPAETPPVWIALCILSAEPPRREYKECGERRRAASLVSVSTPLATRRVRAIRSPSKMVVLFHGPRLYDDADGLRIDSSDHSTTRLRLIELPVVWAPFRVNRVAKTAIAGANQGSGQVLNLAVASAEPVEVTNVAPRIWLMSTGIGRAQSPTPL